MIPYTSWVSTFSLWNWCRFLLTAEGWADSGDGDSIDEATSSPISAQRIRQVEGVLAGLREGLPRTAVAQFENFVGFDAVRVLNITVDQVIRCCSTCMCFRNIIQLFLALQVRVRSESVTVVDCGILAVLPHVVSRTNDELRTPFGGLSAVIGSAMALFFAFAALIVIVFLLYRRRKRFV